VAGLPAVRGADGLGRGAPAVLLQELPDVLLTLSSRPSSASASCYFDDVAIPDINRLLALDVQTRLVLMEKLWDSILQDAHDGAAIPVSAAERELLDARLKDDDDDPEAAIPWAEARAELLRDR